MADTDPDPAHPAKGAADHKAEAAPAEGRDAEPLRARVQRQRRHIEDLTGQDPARGGIDD